MCQIYGHVDTNVGDPKNIKVKYHCMGKLYLSKLNIIAHGKLYSSTTGYTKSYIISVVKYSKAAMIQMVR